MFQGFSSLLKQLHELPPLPAHRGEGVAASRSLTSADASRPVQASLLIPARNAAESLEKTVLEAQAWMGQVFKDAYEIILIPNPRPGDLQDRTTEVAESLAAKYPHVQAVLHQLPQGKGAALRTGYLRARGEWLFFTDADLPYDLGFFAAARTLLDQGYDLVTGNRRLPTSQFDIPVELLPLAYGRHRLGLAFNRLVRFLFPIRTLDTQAGIKAMSRRLADLAFTRQICPGYFFDLELFLTALGHSHRITELPVTLFLTNEKSTVRLARDAVLAIFWLLRLAIRSKKGSYGKSIPQPAA